MTLNYSLVVNVCCCHSGYQKDTRLWKELEKHLAPLIHSQQIALWDSGQIKAGQNPTQEIELRIVSADLILLLVSPDFMSSSSGREQIGLALRQFYWRKTYTIPIILHPYNWETTPIFQLEPLPHNRRPISTWRNRDAALLEVAQGIHSVIERLQMSPRPSREQLAAVHRRIFSMPSLDWKTGFLKDIPISGNDLKHFISTIQGHPAGMQVSGTYRLAKEPLVSGGVIRKHLPLGIPRCTPVSVSIDRPSQNIKLTVSQLTSDGVTIWAAKENESLPLPSEIAGNITIQY